MDNAIPNMERVDIDDVNQIIKFAQSIGLKIKSTKSEVAMTEKTGMHKDKQVKVIKFSAVFERDVTEKLSDDDMKYTHDTDTED